MNLRSPSLLSGVRDLCVGLALGAVFAFALKSVWWLLPLMTFVGD
jgi:hypothetical protein